MSHKITSLNEKINKCSKSKDILKMLHFSGKQRCGEAFNKEAREAEEPKPQK